MSDSVHDARLTALRNLIQSGRRAAESDDEGLHAALSTSRMQIEHQLRRLHALETPLIDVERELKQFADHVADYPPAPPTARGRIGRSIIHLVDRPFWWIAERNRILGRLLLNVSRSLSDQMSAAAGALEEHFRVAAIAEEQRSLRLAAIEEQVRQIRDQLAEIREEMGKQKPG